MDLFFIRRIKVDRYIQIILLVVGVVVLGLVVIVGVVNKEGPESKEVEEEEVVEEDGELGKKDKEEKGKIEEIEEEDDEGEEEINFGDEVEEMSVNKAYIDGIEQNSFEEGKLLKYEGEYFLEEGFVRYATGYSVSYDDLNENSRIFLEGEGDYSPKYEDTGGSFLKVGQFEADIPDGHFSPQEDEEVKYGYVEYEGKLYLSVGVVEKFMKKPFVYDEEGLELDLGVKRTTESVVSFVDDSSKTYVAEGMSIQDNSYEEVIKSEGIGSEVREIKVNNDYRYSTLDSFVLNTSKKVTFDVEVVDDRGEVLFNSVSIKPGRSNFMGLDLRGVGTLTFEIRNIEGDKSDLAEVVIAGEMK